MNLSRSAIKSNIKKYHFCDRFDVSQQVAIDLEYECIFSTFLVYVPGTVPVNLAFKMQPEAQEEQYLNNF
jgi:hypothetical protein